MEALHNLISVYTTGQLIYVVLLLSFISKCPSWVSMELNFAVNISIPALLGSLLSLPPRKAIDNLVVRHSECALRRENCLVCKDFLF